MAAIPASLPSTPSASMLGAHDPDITCPYHSRLGRCRGALFDVRYPWLPPASPGPSQSVMSLNRSTRPMGMRRAHGLRSFSAGAEDLSDLPGAVIAPPQADIGRGRDRPP